MKKTIVSRRFEVDINDYNDMQKAELLKRIKDSKRVRHYLVLDELDRIILQMKDNFSQNSVACELDVSNDYLSKINDYYYRHIFNLIDLSKTTSDDMKKIDTDDQEMLMRSYFAELTRRNKEAINVKH